MRLCASHRPPARSIFRQFTHLAAAGRGFGQVAAAVAATRGDFADSCGSVGPDGKGEDTDGDKEIERQPKGNTAETLGRRDSHGKSFNREQLKTDSAHLPMNSVTGVPVVLD